MYVPMYSPKMLLVILILLLINCAYYTQELDFENIPLCEKNNTSCSYLFGGNYSTDFCQTIYHNVNEQGACDAAYDENAARNENINLGKLILNPFNANDTRTTFNVTFVNIKFLKLKIRFQVYNGEAKVLNKCMVRDFILSDSVPSDKSLSYVCPWSNVSFERSTIDFHYEYGLTELVTRRKLRFFMPIHEYVDEDYTGLFFFIYLDYTDTYNLILKIVPPADRFNVTQFKIDVIYTFGNENETKVSDFLTANGSNLLEYSFNTAGIIGDYHFRVKPVTTYCQNNKCFVEETPKIRIVKQNTSLLIGMVGVSILILICMIIIHIITKKSIKPIVLLVTVPTNDAHVLVAPLLAEFLQKTYNVHVFLDVNDVPNTETKNSFDWLKVAMNHVSHIVFLRSNDHLDSSRVIYQDIYLQTMRLLNPKLSSKKKECIISFPYSSETTKISHPELIHIRKRLNFEKDLNKFIKFLINKKVLLKNKEHNSYKKLLKAIKSLENQETINANHENVFDVQLHVSDDDEEPNLANVQNVDLENIEVNLNLDEFDLLGEQNLQNDENNSDSENDLDDFNFYGNVENV